MADWTCEQCGSAFVRDKSGDRPIRFCGVRCYHDWRKNNNITTGQFRPEHRPWNRGVKGLHLSPSTEYKKGRISERWLPVGSVSIRNDKQGKPRAHVKVAEPSGWMLRAVLVWEEANGSVPDGSVIHHRDRDSLNDILDNLECLTRAEHINEHRHELRQQFEDAA